MLCLFSFFFFVLGVIIGSFLNVVSLRYNTGLSVGGRSFCFSCGKKLKAFELIPLLSFLFLKGKCRDCGSRISIQYPLVEFFTGLVFFLIFWKNYEILFSDPLYFFGQFLFYSVIWSLLIVIFVYDLRHKIIPDGLVFAFIFSSMAVVLMQGLMNGFFASVFIYDFLAGLILPLPFFVLWLVSRGSWIGFGDVKLAVGIGFFLGFIDGIYALILSFWIGALFSIFILLLSHFQKLGILRLSLVSKNFTIKSEIPFAPFLVLGVFAAFFWNVDFLDLRYFFSFIF